MTKYDKTKERLRTRPFKKDISYAEAAAVLSRLGFTSGNKSGSSHQVFRHPDYPKHISIPISDNIKVYTIEDICEALNYFKED